MEKELFEQFEKKGKLKGLSELQIEKFKFACKKAIEVNPKLDFDGLLEACSIYLKLIIGDPGLTF